MLRGISHPVVIWISAASVWVRFSRVTRISFGVKYRNHGIQFFSIRGIAKLVLEFSETGVLGINM